MKPIFAKIIACGAAAAAVCAGSVWLALAYQAGGGFTPGTDAPAMQNNQLLFPENSTAASENSDQPGEKDSFWQQDEAGKNQVGQGENGGYLFDRVQQTDGTYTVNTAQGAAGAGGADIVYDIVNGGKADAVISGSAGQGTGGTANGSGSGSTGSGSVPVPTPAPTPAPETPDAPPPGSYDPEPAEKQPTSGGGLQVLPYSEKAAAQYTQPPTVSVQDRGFGACAFLYGGQTITEKTVFSALNAEVIFDKQSGVIYYWTFEDLGENGYIKIDDISFDNGETWLSQAEGKAIFPAVIPKQLPSKQLQIKVSYRLKKTDGWTRYTANGSDSICCAISDSRVFVLNKRLEAQDISLENSWILNADEEDQYPDVGGTLLLYRWQKDILKGYAPNESGKLDKLFPGWEENGQPVGWNYVVSTPGRHILQPAEPVQIDTEQYTVEIKQFTLTDGQTAAGQTTYAQPRAASYSVALQTLTGASARADAEVCQIPENVQAVQINTPGEGLTAQTITIPRSVVVIDEDSMLSESGKLQAQNAFVVDPENPCYDTDPSGILTNKAQTAYLGIPLSSKELSVPQQVERVLFTEDNQLEKITLQGEQELPALQGAESLQQCRLETETPQQMLQLAHDYTAELAENGNRVDHAQNQQGTGYRVNLYGLTEGEKDEQLFRAFASGISYTIPEGITKIAAGAFSDESCSAVETLVLSPGAGKIELQGDSFAGSKIKNILCANEEQAAAMKQQLKSLGLQNTVQALEAQNSAEGYWYQKVNGTVTLLSAPKDIVFFDGTITLSDGTSLQLNAIGDGAFEGCEQLRVAVLPESVKKIGSRAFAGCKSLEILLIQSKDTITFGEDCLKGCDNLRIVASNAHSGVMENGYDPIVTDKATGCYYMYAPQGCEGYTDHWTSTRYLYMQSYALQKLGNSGYAVYGCSDTHGSWALLRTTKTLDPQFTLPQGTAAILQGAMAYADSAQGGFAIQNLGSLQDIILENYAFAGSGLQGAVQLPKLCGLGKAVFAGCKNLTALHFGEIEEGTALEAGLCNGCDSLQQITFSDEQPPQLTLFSPGMEFRFNMEWPENADEEVKLCLSVPEGSEESYISQWRYAVLGYVDTPNEGRYMYAWWRIWFGELSWGSFGDEQFFDAVDAKLEEKLLRAENYLRTMLGMDAVDEASEVYHFRMAGTLTGAYRLAKTTPGLSQADLRDPAKLGLLKTDKIYYLDENAFARSRWLQKVWLPNELEGIYNTPFAMDEAWVQQGDTITVTVGENIPELMGFSDGTAFSFGVPDECLRLQVSENRQQALLEKWAPPLTGYATREKLWAAVAAQLGTSATQQQIEAAVSERMLQAENRLRAMMGLQPEIPEEASQASQSDAAQQEDDSTV
ncbi:MAG: leucine-rich repeat domain-containing protein [Oscillospiraceae bacterium]|nr:leucine-rich repeat domain-containing protein [Oscillospiraceae bacterium]